MTAQWTLTLVEYDENDMPQHETLATCNSRSEMVDAILMRHDFAYKCYVTEENNAVVSAYGYGDIVEQTNAQEWLEDELKECAPMPESERPSNKPTKKHPVKRIPLGNGEFHTDMYEYRGYTISRNDNVPHGYWGRWEVWPGGYTTATRQDVLRWIDERIAKQEATLAAA